MSGLPVLLFLDVSGGELLVILLVVFLVFGPEKMPDMARKAGRLMNQMKKASNDLTREFKKETSVLQNEIKTVHNQVNTEVESVTREYNRTKAQVTKEMSPETASESSSEKATEVDEPIIKAKVDPEPPVKDITVSNTE